MASQQKHTFVFLGGLHRSGTTLLARCLAEHPLVSAFENTGAPADEGQHLQSVYPPAKAYGGPGRFGFAPEAHLTESSPLVSAESHERLLSEWQGYWDLSKPVLLEKSPPNLIRGRFLQALFPGSYFLMIVRHPVPVSLATAKWRKTRRLHELIEHWLVCHELFAEDRTSLEKVHVVRYEDLVGDPAGSLGKIHTFLGLESRALKYEISAGSNEAYFARWKALRRQPLLAPYLGFVRRRYERRVERFGYSLRDLGFVGDPQILGRP